MTSLEKNGCIRKGLAMPTREEAIETLQSLVDSGVLSEEKTESLEQIIRCIECENDGLFIWGAEGDWIQLYIGYREDLWTDEMKKNMENIFEKYRIKEKDGE